MILVDIMWANLHLPDAKNKLAIMERVAGLCEEAGGTVQWLQSSTTTADNIQHSRAGSISHMEMELVPITVLTCIVRWRAERIT
jgi:hypothetical protein